MKNLLTLITVGICLIITSDIMAQSSQGPFADLIGKEIRTDNIFMLWQETGGSTISFQKVIKYDIENDLLDIQDNAARGFANNEVGGSKQMVAASGNLNNDLYDDVVAAWEGLNGTIELYIPKFDSTEVMWNAASSYTITGPITSEVNYLQGRILLEVADLNGSGRDEIIVVYKGENQGIHLEVLGTDENLIPDLKDSLTVEQVYNIGYTHPPAALTIADMDGDGNPEIVVASLIKNGTNNRWALNLHRFEFNSNEELVRLAPIVTGIQDVSSLYDYTQIRFTLGSGKLINGDEDQLLIAMSYDALGAPSANDTFLYSYSYDQGNNSLNSLDRLANNLVFDSNGMDPMAIKTGDLDGDGLDEVVFAAEGTHYVLDINNSFKFEEKFNFGQSSSQFGLSYDYVEIADINQNGLNEIIVAVNKNSPSRNYFQLRAFSAYDKTNNEWRRDDVGQILNTEHIDVGSSAGPRRYALATGGFDGYAFRLGEPDYFEDTGDLQPLVILNAPPIHFDVFNDVKYDINNCFPANECDFKATYTTIEDKSKSLQTEVRGDFAASVGVGGEGEITTAPMGVGASVSYEAYFDVNFGAGFSNTDQEIRQIRIENSKTTSVDDQIYASITNYDVWRYPVYHGAETTPRRYMVSVEPNEVQTAWFSTKSWNASKYIPNHEVGNILSYPSYSEISENPEVQRALNYFGDEITLDSSSGDTWILNIAEIAVSEEDKNIKAGYDLKANVGVVRASSSGSLAEITTHSSTIREGLVINVQLDKINLGYGETRYKVTPYAYWNKDGALVVDYAAEPERSGQGGVQTWWEEFYGHDPDPAFILPWRYDPEKGMSLSDDIRRFRTKDVFFDNYEPTAGDTLTITARVRNFSLVDSPPVPVRFYVGDPDDGGELIVGVDGESTLTTTNGIAAQRTTDVQMRWIVPSNLPQNPRIFAVLNEDADFNEIHRNNNKGFNVLSPNNIITSNEEIAESTIPESFKLHQSYPNPFNPTTTIGYELPQNTAIKLEVFNVLGQRVATLVDGVQPSGFHEVQFDASSLSSGLYLYRLTTESFSETKRMMLIK